MAAPQIKLHVLPGGMMPKRQTTGSIGYDVHIRAIVSATEMDPNNSVLRQTLFDFENMPDVPRIKWHIKKLPKENGGGTDLVYMLEPGETALAGIGFVTEMPFPIFYSIVPRSGLATKHGITVTNAPGTVDPDYRGEAGVLIFNQSNQYFPLRHGMRIAQIIFQRAIIPDIELVDSYENLSSSIRSANGFGSTGLV